MAIVFWWWNPVEYIQKIVISFLTVPLDEINYGVRHRKLFKIQNQPFADVPQDRFFSKIAKFTEIHLCLSLFHNKVASELRQIFMSNFPYRTVKDDCFWKGKSFFLSKFIIKVILIFNEVFFQTYGRNDTNIRKQFFLKKLRICFEKIVVFWIRQTSFL